MAPMRDLRMAEEIARKTAEAGGRAYFVGGFVRDRLMRNACKDVDIEVHGLTPDRLRSILDACGERLEMGASFGVFGLRGYGLDIAMPRKERAFGAGHRDFDVEVDPFLGIREAARRRDFTVNAMMMDVLTGEILDPFDGQGDLKRGILRHVSDASFGEDPLRALRAAQFAARFGFAVAEETARICSGMDLTLLAKERVFTELRKALMQAAHPSVFFETLRDMNQLSGWFSEAETLIGIRQDPAFHPEGDVWTHTLRVLDSAAALRMRAEDPLSLMLAALCHDFGKPAVSRMLEGRIRAFGHEAAGVPAARRFLSRLTDEARIHKRVESLVRMHMRPGALCMQQAGEKAFMRMYDESPCPEDLILLSLADCRGTGFGNDGAGQEQKLREELEIYRKRMAVPLVSADDLIEAGYEPGPAFGRALAYAHKLQLVGVGRQQTLGETLAFMRRETGEEGGACRDGMQG